MSLWAIIPVKPLNRAKSRLADVLSPEQRHALAAAMFRQVLVAVTTVPQVAGTLVVSRDTKALSIARDYGARTLQESNPAELNAALTRATEVVRMWNASAVLVLPADLPFVTKEDISAVIHLSGLGSSVVLATDKHHDGTNALLVRPPGILEYQYGDGSYQKHLKAAKALVGAEVQIYESETMQLDIDVPEDLEEYNRIVHNGQYALLPPFFPNRAY